jgi:predicted Rossmann-fold nucleotide-binding protein
MDGGRIVYEAEFSPFIDEYVPNDKNGEPFFPEGVTFADLFKPGMEIGKLYANNSESVLSAEEVAEKISLREIIVGEHATVNEDGTIRLPIHPYVYHPTKLYDWKILAWILDRTIGRAELMTYQEPHLLTPDDYEKGIHIPARGGVVAQTSILAGNYELEIIDPFHTDANIRSMHSGETFHVELKGNGQDRYEKYVNIRVMHPAKAQAKKVIVPGIDIENTSNIEKLVEGPPGIIIKQSRKVDVHVLATDNITDRFEVDFVTGAGIKTVKTKLAEYGGASIFVNQFPQGKEFMFFQDLAYHGLMRGFSFAEAPRFQLYFSTDDITRLDDMQDIGVHVVWQNRKLHMDSPLVYYHNFFMNPNIIPQFSAIRKAGRILGIYGSGGSGVDVSDQTTRELYDLIAGYRAYYKQPIGLITGGGPNAMAAANQFAFHQQDCLSGVSCWYIPSVEPPNPFSHFKIYMDVQDFGKRQGIIFDNSDIGIFLRGGAGTSEEFFTEFVHKKLYISDKPVVLLDSDYWRGLDSYLQHMQREGTVSGDYKIFRIGHEPVPDSPHHKLIYCIDQGSDIGRVLDFHYRFAV